MRTIICCFLLFTLPEKSSTHTLLLRPDKATIYSALSSGDSTMINEALSALNDERTHEAEAYKGALLMKKASFLGKPNQKLKTFKSGYELLENAIENQPENAEFRFLRLMIQENAPKFLTYHSDIKSDADYIVENFNQLSPVVKKEVKGYSQKSKALTPEDFN